MTINEYFKNPMRFRNKIIIISAKDEASRYIANFRAGFDMGLELKIKFRESYVALIDMKRDFSPKGVAHPLSPSFPVKILLIFPSLIGFPSFKTKSQCLNPAQEAPKELYTCCFPSSSPLI